MKRIVLISIIAIMIPLISSAQKERKGSWNIGGSMGMQFGDYTNINIAPQIGYNFNDFFTLGGGLSYSYFKNKEYDRTINYLGANLYARIFPLRYITIFAQPELLHRWGKMGSIANNEGTFATLLVGGGLAIPVGYKSRLIAEIYYDVLQDRLTSYGDKIGYSIGYSFSF